MSFHRLPTAPTRLLAAAIIVLLTSGLVAAQVPPLLNYQGRLTSTQTAVDTVVPITFTIYNDSLGAVSAWSETHPAVVVDDGLFAVLLGSVAPLPKDLFSGSSRYLGVKVGDDVEGAPLTRIVSAAYALKASRADTASYAEAAGGGWTDDGGVVRLTDGSDFVGIGTSSPTNVLHIRGTDSQPLLNIEKTGSGRGLRISTVSACALWVASAGNHGLRVSSANGDGIHVTTAGGYAGWFGGKGYFSGNLGIGTLNPSWKLDVVGGSIGTDGQLISMVASGTPPLDVQSETLVANLNADLLDGLHAGDIYTQTEVDALLAERPKQWADLETTSTNASAQVTITFPGGLFSQTPSLAATAQFNRNGYGQLGRVTVIGVSSTNATLYIEDGNSLPLTNSPVQISYTATE
jgi:hypothetical protein